MATQFFFLNPDAGLLEQIRQGDEQALASLYRSNRKAITGFVTRNNGSVDDAEDMLQEALVVLWERVRAGRFEQSSKLSTFIFATVRNMWMRKLSRIKRETPSAIDPERYADDCSTPLEELLENEVVTGIQQALDRLGEPCRKLLLLFYWEELSLGAIAKELRFANADTVKSKKYQCKKALEKLLKSNRD